jgi:hypothetical protein
MRHRGTTEAVLSKDQAAVPGMDKFRFGLTSLPCTMRDASGNPAK